MTWMRCGRRLRRKCKGRQSLKSFKTDEIRQLVAAGLEEFVGVEYTPVAYLGSQVVAGTNYAILCQGRAVVPDAEPYWVILYLYQDLEGKVSVLGIVNLDLGIINLDLAV